MKTSSDHIISLCQHLLMRARLFHNDAIKDRLRSRLSKVNLQANFRVTLTADLKPDVAELVENKQCHIS